MKKENWLVIIAGVLVGVAALVLTKLGNPANMGFCIACFERDIAGAVGLHSAAKVQYVRPEIIGLVLGAFIMALAGKEFRPQAGSSPATRFVLGAFVMIGALVFLGCPLRMVLRMGGGDLNALVGLAGLFEGIGILLLLFVFVPQFGLEGIWISVFTAISAFCNAGFDLFGRFGQYSSLVPYVNNYYVQAVVMFMIISGGLGFMVWVEIGEYHKKHRLSLQAKVVLSFSVILWLGGAALIALMEWNNPASMGGLSVPGKLMAALFQSVSTRTAGMNTIDLAACGPITKLLMSVLQFIGAAPGSTGGGVKVTTFAVIILTIRSVAQGRDDCVIAEHHIESKTVYRALTIIVLGGLAAVGSAVVVYYNTSEAVSIIDAIFESCSAFGTVGLSVGVTSQLNRGAKALYMAVMFMGRVGPVSLAMSLTAKPDDNKRKIMPVGHINVG